MGQIQTKKFTEPRKIHMVCSYLYVDFSHIVQDIYIQFTDTKKISKKEGTRDDA